MQERIVSSLTPILIARVVAHTLILVALLLGLLAWVVGIRSTGDLQKLMSDLSSIMLSLMTISIVLLIFFFLSMFFIKMFKEEGIVILPFETSAAGDNKYNGKAISDLLTAELHRIKKIRKYRYEQLHPSGLEKETYPKLVPQTEILYNSMPLTFFKSDPQTKTLYYNAPLDFPKLIPQTETLCYSLDKMGSVGIGSNTVSIGQLLIALKRICPGCNPGRVITGSMQTYGSVIRLVVCLEHHEVYTWEVNRKIKEEDQVSDLIRDLAFKIAYDLLKEEDPRNTLANTWVGFKYFTEALYSYDQYMLTGKKKALVSCQIPIVG